ncbi:hypothetical protein GCM10011428_29080 [Streptomyces violaceus]|uniref:hypothetical protein n=1 Tax=Streptomyces violaceus TaxID=1936 RepID=UPI0031E5D747
MELVLGIGGLEVERDGRALRRVVDLLQRVRGLAARDVQRVPWLSPARRLTSVTSSAAMKPE